MKRLDEQEWIRSLTPALFVCFLLRIMALLMWVRVHGVKDRREGFLALGGGAVIVLLSFFWKIGKRALFKSVLPFSFLSLSLSLLFLYNSYTPESFFRFMRLNERIVLQDVLPDHRGFEVLKSECATRHGARCFRVRLSIEPPLGDYDTYIVV